MAYQFSHISAYYNEKKRDAYCRGDMKSGDAYDSLSMHNFKLSK